MTDTEPTVVLVHGAFADASSFARVIPELLAGGLPVVAPAVPMRSLAGDAAYVASVIRQIDGPVILVGHSYGGAVITVAGIEDNVRALVYLSAYALEEGESLGELQGRFPDPPPRCRAGLQDFPGRGQRRHRHRRLRRRRQVPRHLRRRRRAGAGPGPRRRAAPPSRCGLRRAGLAAAWKTKPAWGSVSINDHTINPDVERFGYKRAGITTIEIDSSHLVMLSHPKEVTDLIRTAIETTAS